MDELKWGQYAFTQLIFMNEDKMKQFLEKVSILSLSLCIDHHHFQLSSALPSMFDYYQGYSTGQVELLVSLPSFGIMAMLLLNGVLERIFPERLQLTLGLLILSISGTAPFWYQGILLCLCDPLAIWTWSWDAQCQGHLDHQ